jgi:hypothetical protein
MSRLFAVISALAPFPFLQIFEIHQRSICRLVSVMELIVTLRGYGIASRVTIILNVFVYLRYYGGEAGN